MTEAQGVSSFQTKSGEFRDKRTLVLMDDTGYELNATMWGEICSMEINQGQIIAVKGAGVSEYGGKSLNLSNDSSLIQVDPEEEPRFHALK